MPMPHPQSTISIARLLPLDDAGYMSNCKPTLEESMNPFGPDELSDSVYDVTAHHQVGTEDQASPSFFRGKTLVITGASGQFGREGCIYFAKRGARIAALDVEKEGLLETFNALKDLFGSRFDCKIFLCDVTNAAHVQETVKAIVARFERIDLLWNNAGYQGMIKPTLEYDSADFAKVLNINVTGMFIVLQACAKQMANQGSLPGCHPFSIVITASVAALRGTPAMIAYSSSKAALLAMTVSASKDLAPHGIRVNSISPALIGPGKLWDRQNELHAVSGSPYFDSSPERVAQAKLGAVPLKRLGSVEEVLKAVAFLLSDEASYTTGANLVIDGGLASGLKA